MKLGENHGNGICEESCDGTYKNFPKELQNLQKAVQKIVSNSRFKPKMCTINFLWKANWKLVMNPHAK